MSKQPKTAHHQHDRSHRMLFTHAKTIEDLLLGFVRESWVEELNFRTLRKLPNQYISSQLPGNFEERASDVVWQIHWKGRPLYIVILLELQSTCSEDMALRMLVYIGLFYQRLLKNSPLHRGEKLPPILPLVLYNGDKQWDAPLEIGDLMEPVSTSFESYLPRLRYGLVDSKRWPEEQLEALHNVVAAMFRLERGPSFEKFQEIVDHLLELLGSSHFRDLERDLVAWLSKVVLPSRLPDTEFPNLTTLDEFKTTMTTQTPTWNEQWLMEGFEKGHHLGLKEGRREGQRSGEATVLLRQLKVKYGPLTETVQKRVKGADGEQLLKWADRVLTASSIEEVLED